jgi:hypothetical protein
MEDPTPQSNKPPEDIFADAETSDQKVRVASHDSLPNIDQKVHTNESTPLHTPGRRHNSSGKRVITLMIIAIVVILIGGIGYIAYRAFTAPAVSTTATIEDVVDNPDVNTQVPPEVLEEESVVNRIDSDSDGLTDDRERELGLDILSSDTDNDNLSDRDEIDFYFTDPFDSDTDNDGFSDGDEVRRGYNPKGSGTLTDITNQLQ